jgi:hypothetical protein
MLQAPSVTAAAELRIIAAARRVTVRELATAAQMPYWRVAGILSERISPKDAELNELRAALFGQATR